MDHSISVAIHSFPTVFGFLATIAFGLRALLETQGAADYMLDRAWHFSIPQPQQQRDKGDW